MTTRSMSGRVVLGRYRIVAPLARGGMGIIYLGRLEGAAGFAKPVVIKTVIPDAKDQRSAQLFVREARILSNLEHPAIVGVLDFGEVDGEYIMVLEYVHGFHLGFWARYVKEARGQMLVSHCVEVMLPVLEALDFAHRLTRSDGMPLDIVHRDISPANILLDQAGHVKLHDFGIARIADDEFKTQDGTFRGTLSFTAPETLQGQPATPRSDVYGCGVVLYQLITGANPFRGEQPSETLHRVCTYIPPLLSTVRSDVPDAVAQAVARALEKDPADRFESAEAFAAALRAARTWSEEDANTDLAHAIHDDFLSAEMPKFLGVETLQSRDHAWRASQAVRNSVPLSSSHPPPRRSEGGITAAMPVQPLEPATIQAIPSKALMDLITDGGGGQVPPSAASPYEHSEPSLATAAAAAAPPASLTGGATAAAVVAAAPKASRPLWPFALVAVAALGAAAAYPILKRQDDAPPSRYLVIEKQSDAEPAAQPSVAAPAPTPASPDPLPSIPSGDPAPSGRVSSTKPVRPGEPTAPSSSTSSASSGSSISAAFQRQRGRVEACFRSSPDAATPQLTIRFQIEASGAVRAADLSPPSVAASPLGACILGVARSTQFPAGDAPISFSIPITARKTSG